MNAALRAVGAGRYGLDGEVTVDTVPGLWPQIAAVADKGGDVEVSCAGITRADSAAVACLLEWARVAGGVGGSVRVCDLPEVMRVIMEVSDLDGILIGASTA
ncbi:MAG: STAS domain-containing protein [Acidihalobacter sp.]